MSERTSPQRAKEPLRNCIERCEDCHDVCMEALPGFLQGSQEHGQYLLVRLLLDTAQLCDATRDLMLRSSDFYRQLCRLCAEVCDRCAQACAREREDPMLARCVDECRRCAAACREVA
jgi:hypothetical protein